MESEDRLAQSIATSLICGGGRNYCLILGKQWCEHNAGTEANWLVSLKLLLEKASIDSVIVESPSTKVQAILSYLGIEKAPFHELSTTEKLETRIISCSSSESREELRTMTKYLNNHGALMLGMRIDDEFIMEALRRSSSSTFSRYALTETELRPEFVDELERFAVTVRVENCGDFCARIADKLPSKKNIAPGREKLPSVNVVLTSNIPIEMVPPAPQNQDIRVLAIDGGGIRGIIPAVILAEIEARTERPIAKLFDVIVGTSTGAILAMALTSPGPTAGTIRHSAQDLLRMYHDHGEEIFPKGDRVHWKGNCLKAVTILPRIRKLIEKGLKKPYSAKGFEDSIAKYFDENSRLSDLYGDVCITTYELESRNVRVLSNRQSKVNSRYNLTLREAARSTSAAPTYFQPLVRNVPGGAPTELSFIDGGVFANNPALCAFAEAKRLHGSDKTVLLVSIGTGEDPPAISGRDACTWLSGWWTEHIIDILMHGNSQVTHKILEELLRRKPGEQADYYRFQPKLTQCEKALDFATKNNINRLATIARNYIENEIRDNFDELIERLTPTPIPEHQ